MRIPAFLAAALVVVAGCSSSDGPTSNPNVKADATYEVVFDPMAVREHLFGDGPLASVLIAESEVGEVAGFALWFPTFSTFLGRPGIWLEDLFVRPAHRGRGHGVALLRRLRDLTDGRVEWAVLDWNTPSIAFYEELGAKPVSGWTRYRW